MTINESGLELIKGFEGCVLTGYLCPAGKPTIGWGHIGSDVRVGQNISQHQADTVFQYDVDKFAEGVAELTRTLVLTENQFAALVSLAFNLGLTRFASSTLYKRLMANDFEGAAAQFEKWVLVNGHISNGLKRRRAAERALFETP